MMCTKSIDLSHLAESWPSSMVARSEVERFSGGILSAGYLANLDCIGRGPTGRIRIGRKVAYPVNALIEWMEARAEVL
jgi:hypothetical protein